MFQNHQRHTNADNQRDVNRIGSHTDILRHYKELFLEVQQEFYESHWPCEATDKTGNRCINVASGHSKGHQSSNGKPFGDGQFKSSFSDGGVRKVLQEEFLGAVKMKPKTLVDELKQNQITLDGSWQEDRAAANIHLARTMTSYSKRWSLTERKGETLPLVSFTTCFFLSVGCSNPYVDMWPRHLS